jgi:heme-degrading monooxygenase HmoA
VSYEILRFGARYRENGFVRALFAPNIALQGLTTKVPDDSQVEVAIASFEATLAAAAEEFWPKLQEAAGFRRFFLIQGEDGQTLGIILWDSEQHAAAFRSIADTWQARLDGLGHSRIARGAGEVTEV